MSDKVACTQCGKDHELIDLLRGLCPVCLFAQAVPDAARRSDSREARFVPPKILELAPHFPQLKILELIGQGGMSAVYKARQMSLDRTVAVKLLPQEVADSHGGLERFRQEAKTLAQLSHPNIVNVYDAGQAGPWCFIVMEFINGPNLRQLLGDSNLPTSDVLRYASEICDGLQYAHDRGVVHRDVKPENVLIADDGHVRLVDFGLAKLLKPSGSATTQTGRVIGTPHYLAPEQVETPGKVDHRADVYSLGVLIYEMLTGELPLGHFAPPSRRIGSDPAFDAVVLRAMARDAQQRYQCVRDVRAGIAAATAGGNSVLASKYRATWQTTASELFLSIGSIFAGLVGCCVLLVAFVVTDQNAPRKRSEPRVLGHFESRDPGKPVVTRVQEGDFVYDTTAPPEFLPAPGGELRSATSSRSSPSLSGSHLRSWHVSAASDWHESTFLPKQTGVNFHWRRFHLYRVCWQRIFFSEAFCCSAPAWRSCCWDICRCSLRFSTGVFSEWTSQRRIESHRSHPTGSASTLPA